MGTRKARHPAQIDKSAPWDDWVRLVESALPPPGCRGRPRVPVITMLRMLVAQRAPAMSDRETEDELRFNESIHCFLHSEEVPDRTTLREFRNWLVSKGLCRKIFDLLVAILEARGTIRQGASLVGPAFIESPSPTKNRAHARDPDAHSAKKGNTWHFGYKGHVGCDRDSGLAHTVVTTAANVADITVARQCIRRGDEEAYLDAGYVGLEKREEAQEGGELEGVTLFVAAKRSTVKTDEQRFREHAVSSVRSPAEHPYHYVKDIIGLRRTRYKGLSKNDEMICLAFALSNLLQLSRDRVTCLWSRPEGDHIPSTRAHPARGRATARRDAATPNTRSPLRTRKAPNVRPCRRPGN
jgi:IS5 family transposase